MSAEQQSLYLAWAIETFPEANREYMQTGHYQRAKEMLKTACAALIIRQMAEMILFLAPAYRLLVQSAARDHYQDWEAAETRFLNEGPTRTGVLLGPEDAGGS